MELILLILQERKKDLNEHRDDSMFSFDPANISVKILAKNHQKKIDARKGVLLASYSRKKTRRRKRGRSNAIVGGTGIQDHNNSNNHSQQSQQNGSPTPQKKRYAHFQKYCINRIIVIKQREFNQNEGVKILLNVF